MSASFALRGLSLFTLAALAGSCGGGGDGTAPAGSGAAASAKAPGSTSPAVTAAAEAKTAEAAPQVPPTIVVIGVKKVSIALPPGLTENSVGSGNGVKMFSKGEKHFDGFAVTLAAERGGATLALFERQIEAQKDSKKSRVLAKESWDGGWALAYEFEEGGKKNVGLMSSIGVDGTAYMCRGDASGSALSDVDGAAKVLMTTCRSMKAAG